MSDVKYGSMIGSLLGPEIKEGEEALVQIDQGLQKAETQVVPFLEKIAPVAEAGLTELINLSPSFKAVVTPEEIAEFASGITAIPALLSALHDRIVALESQLKSV